MFNVEQNDDLLDLDIYAESNYGPIEFEMTGGEKTISGEEALKFQQCLHVKKLYYRKQQLLSPKRSN